MGVDLGGTKIHTALADEEGNILAEVRIATGAQEGQTAVIQRMVDSVAEVCTALGDNSTVDCIGVGVPGTIHPDTGLLFVAPNLGWENIPLRSLLQEKLAAPVYTDNDANLGAWGESLFGAGVGMPHLMYVTVSTGIGAGLILNGNIIHGVQGGAGEIGHMVLDPQGPLCHCGKRGCLEALASGTAIAKTARQLVAAGQGQRILAQAQGQVENITAQTVAQAAAQGDPQAVEILKHAGSMLGLGLANAAELLNPGLIILGGGAMNAGESLWFSMQQSMAQNLSADTKRQLTLVPAALGKRSALMGAVALALSEFRAAK